ncbi:MAG: hypothetical protein QNJ94_16310 [Alphaproteobacteria bacterium]|nr:hypothetical protein [Alphaproteobacteria bacterium]
MTARRDAAKAIIVHDLAQARAAVAAAAAHGRPITLWSPPGAAAYLGASYFLSLVAAARADHPTAEVDAVLDCADDAGWVLAALRRGVAGVCFHGTDRVAAKLADIAGQYGATLHRAAPDALDLAKAADPAQACREWLAG